MTSPRIADPTIRGLFGENLEGSGLFETAGSLITLTILEDRTT